MGTKLTEEDYGKLEALAAGRGITPGECVRELVRGAFGEGNPEATPPKPATTAKAGVGY